MTVAETAQVRFDRTYITSREIMKRLGVTRPTVSQARKRGLLPDGIVVSDTLVWERETVESNLQAWERLLKIKRTNKQ
jgi:predicted DNA-binding transcriptional regulator AlpA